MSDKRTEAHEELRRRGMTDDVPTEPCLVTALFWLIGLASILAAVAGVVLS